MAERITRTIVIDRDPNEIYSLWVQYDNLPKFLKHIRGVFKTGPGTSHWVMKGPLGRDVEWDARIIRTEPEQIIAWESIRGDVQTDGQVNFHRIEPGRAEVTVTLQYQPKESVRSIAGSLFDNPGADLEEGLANLKALAERTPAHRL